MKNKQMKKQEHLPHSPIFFYLLSPSRARGRKAAVSQKCFVICKSFTVTLCPTSLLHAGICSVWCPRDAGEGQLLHGPLPGCRELLLCRNALCFFLSNSLRAHSMVRTSRCGKESPVSTSKPAYKQVLSTFRVRQNSNSSADIRKIKYWI